MPMVKSVAKKTAVKRVAKKVTPVEVKEVSKKAAKPTEKVKELCQEVDTKMKALEEIPKEELVQEVAYDAPEKEPLKPAVAVSEPQIKQTPMEDGYIKVTMLQGVTKQPKPYEAYRCDIGLEKVVKESNLSDTITELHTNITFCIAEILKAQGIEIKGDEN